MAELHVPSTTHTVEMAQIAEINSLLHSRPASRALTASDIGLAGATLHGSHQATLSDSATLVRLTWQGSPEYPYIFGHFSPQGSGAASLVVDLHTSALQALCRLLSLHHSWGMGVPPRQVP